MNGNTFHNFIDDPIIHLIIHINIDALIWKLKENDWD